MNSLINFSKNSLHRYLNQRYLAILLLLITLFGALILFMRSSAMDDTTDYYMHYDAQVLSEYYKKGDDIAEFDEGYKEYYWGIKNLPERYRLLLKVNDEQAKVTVNETQTFKLADKFVYILPYFSPEKAEILFVLHIFSLQSEAMFYQSWQSAFTLLMTLLLVFVILYSLYTNRHITRQMTGFSDWIQSMNHLSYDELQRQKPPEFLIFDELICSANYLQSSLLTQFDLKQKEQALLTREKHFLSSLSHELRTSMAITAAALTLLNKSEQLIAKDRATLAKLHRAHLTMKQLTNTILQLWRGQHPSSQNIVVNERQNKIFLLDELVEKSMQACQQQFSRRNLSFEVNIQGNTKIFSQLELADILIQNLLRNACQYSANDKVKLEINNHCLLIENSIGENNDSEKTTTNQEMSDVNYGYGVGLFMAETICQQQDWQLKITSKASVFTVQVNFSDTA